jgi:hypothetical protein
VIVSSLAEYLPEVSSVQLPPARWKNLQMPSARYSARTRAPSTLAVGGRLAVQLPVGNSLPPPPQPASSAHRTTVAAGYLTWSGSNNLEHYLQTCIDDALEPGRQDGRDGRVREGLARSALPRVSLSLQLISDGPDLRSNLVVLERVSSLDAGKRRSLSPTTVE